MILVVMLAPSETPTTGRRYTPRGPTLWKRVIGLPYMPEKVGEIGMCAMTQVMFFGNYLLLAARDGCRLSWEFA
jgi:hypothetical protein